VGKESCIKWESESRNVNGKLRGGGDYTSHYLDNGRVQSTLPRPDTTTSTQQRRLAAAMRAVAAITVANY